MTVVDEIEAEWDVYVGTELMPFLHLCPLPSSSLATRFNASSLAEGRFKATARRLELTLPFGEGEESSILATERADELQMKAGIRLAGQAWPWRPVQYMVGAFEGGKLLRFIRE